MVMRRFTAEKSRSKKSRINLHSRPSFQKRMSRRMVLKGGEGRVSFWKLKTVSRKGGLVHTRNFVFKRMGAVFLFSDFGDSSDNSFRIRQKEAVRHFHFLNELRKIPSLKDSIPPTVRLVRGIPGRLAPGLLLTDLTHNGKLLVTGELYNPAFGKRSVDKKVKKFVRIAKRHGFKVTLDSFLVQVDPETRKAVKVWICDAGGIENFKK